MTSWRLMIFCYTSNQQLLLTCQELFRNKPLLLIKNRRVLKKLWVLYCIVILEEAWQEREINVFKLQEKDTTWRAQCLLTNDYYWLSSWQKATVLAIALVISGFSKKPYGNCRGEEESEFAPLGENTLPSHPECSRKNPGLTTGRRSVNSKCGKPFVVQHWLR